MHKFFDSVKNVLNNVKSIANKYYKIAEAKVNKFNKSFKVLEFKKKLFENFIKLKCYIKSVTQKVKKKYIKKKNNLWNKLLTRYIIKNK